MFCHFHFHCLSHATNLPAGKFTLNFCWSVWAEVTRHSSAQIIWGALPNIEIWHSCLGRTGYTSKPQVAPTWQKERKTAWQSLHISRLSFTTTYPLPKLEQEAHHLQQTGTQWEQILLLLIFNRLFSKSLSLELLYYLPESLCKPKMK